MPRILFLCTGNAARSQIAEALARRMAAPEVEVFSAGTQPRAVHPLAVRAMAERGIDISQHSSKGLGQVPRQADIVVTLSDGAADQCPSFPPKTERIHWSLPDPAAARGSEEYRLAVFRGVAAEIESRLARFLQEKGLARSL